MIKPLISIDWDHTFRNMHGLDLNILALVAYANAKSIPVGLTTHRDKENTTLYSFAYWQNQKPVSEKNPLAAAINFWEMHLFSKLNIKFDFINARYQPNYMDKNYYKEVLLPHETMLAEQIKHGNLLRNPENIRKIIAEYEKPEDTIANNEFKGLQLNWLGAAFADKFNGDIYHIDDSHDVCQHAQTELLQSNTNSQVKIHTVYYEQGPFFCNESCHSLLNNVGLLSDWQSFLEGGCVFENNDENLYLSLCLLATQICYAEPQILEHMYVNLSELSVSKSNAAMSDFIQTLSANILQQEKPIHFYMNEWLGE